MRIGIDARFAIRDPRRGIGTYSLHLLRALAKENIQDEFIFYIDQDDVNGVLPLGSNIKTRCIHPAIYPIWEQVILPIIIFRDRLDLFHSLGNTAPLLLRKKIKLILTLHDVMFLETGDHTPRPTSLYQKMGRIYRSIVAPLSAHRAAAVITVSEFSRQDILQKIPDIEPKKVFAISEACDPIFLSAPNQGSKVYKRPFFLCLGAEDPRKNTFRVVQAFLNAVEKHEVDQDLVISGYANWIASPEYCLVKQSNAGQRVHFLSFVSIDELTALYREATALLYLSLYEGFGIPVLEAFNCGCPVIASNTTSIPEVAGNAAIYLDPNDVTAIQSAIVQVSEDPLLLSRLKSRGKKRAKHFSWENAARQTLSVYMDVMQKIAR